MSRYFYIHTPMRAFLRYLLLKPILSLVERYSSAPDRKRVFSALSKLRKTVESDPGKKGFVIPFNYAVHRFIIFSDQHKGRKNGADDFMMAEKNYLAALAHYHRENYHLIALGDCEELWENTMLHVIAKNKPSFEHESRFVRRNAFTKIVGNHDLDWQIDPLAPALLKKIYGKTVPIFEGIQLQTAVEGKDLRIFCTHGHQGDLQSDGNWFSKFFVTKVWAPLQAYLRINPNTPAYDQDLKSEHNRMMYEWAEAQDGLILVTGHTHQPVFESMTHFERLQRKHRQALHEQNPQWAEAIENELLWRGGQVTHNFHDLKPVYFNTGCCCFSDGDITGIEIADERIRLVKWKTTNGVSARQVLEEKDLKSLTHTVA